MERSIALVGDSDIDLWPSSEYPLGVQEVSGHSGATLADIQSPLQRVLKSPEHFCVLILCAGENDISSGILLGTIESTLRDVLKGTQSVATVIFLGPKFEPWLQDDRSSRKQYLQLHKTCERVCQEFDNVHYMDSLTLFCDNANVPGSWLKSKPDRSYFASDGLHLSKRGYHKWKTCIESLLDGKD